MEKTLVFGSTCWHLLAEYDHPLCAWKTSQYTLFGEAEKWLGRLPNWGTIVNGELYEVGVPSVLPIEGHDGFVLPTPTTDQRPQRYKQGGRSTLCAILEGDMKLPTPTANDAKNNPSTPSEWSRHTSLNVECAKLEGKTQETIGKKSRLHPHFVEWMMGFPIGWTELDP